MEDDRFRRHLRLPEIGEAGQAKLSRTHVSLKCAGLAGEVEARYLRGAGVAIDDRSAQAKSTRSRPSWLTELEGAPAEVAFGAWHALETIREIVAMKSVDGEVADHESSTP